MIDHMERNDAVKPVTELLPNSIRLLTVSKETLYSAIKIPPKLLPNTQRLTKNVFKDKKDIHNLYHSKTNFSLTRNNALFVFI